MTLCECSSAILAAGVRRAEAATPRGRSARSPVRTHHPWGTQNAFSEDSFGHTACGALVDPPASAGRFGGDTDAAGANLAERCRLIARDRIAGTIRRIVTIPHFRTLGAVRNH